MDTHPNLLPVVDKEWQSWPRLNEKVSTALIFYASTELGLAITVRSKLYLTNVPM